MLCFFIVHSLMNRAFLVIPWRRSPEGRCAGFELDCRAPFERRGAKGNAGGPDGADITSAIPEGGVSIADEIFGAPGGFRALARET
jgi:hypothetical protein